MKRKLTDKLFLVITAIATGSLLMGTIFFLQDYLSLSKEWVMFVLSGGLYFVVVVYIATAVGKGYKRKSAFMLYVVSITLIVLLLMFIFLFFHVVPLPKFIVPYIIAETILAPIPILAAKRMTRANRVKRGQSKLKNGTGTLNESE